MDGPVNLSALTDDELEALAIEKRAEAMALKAERRLIRQEWERRAIIGNLARKLGIPVDGLTFEQAEAMLVLSQAGPARPGDVVVTPEPAVFTARGGEE